MRYRKAGRLDIELSEIGFGCGSTAGLMVHGTKEEQLDVVSRALELGVNYFDTAPAYGDRASEANLGRALRTLGARPYVTTKVEVRAVDLEDIAGHVERSLDASLQALGVDSVDFVQIHNAPVAAQPHLEGARYSTLWVEDFLGPRGALEGLQRAQQKGKVRWLGFVTRGDDAEPAQRLLDTGAFQIVNASYHLLNPTAAGRAPDGVQVDADWGGMIERAHAAGAAVAVYSPLGNGVLNDQVIAGRGPHPLADVRREAAVFQARVERARAFGFLSTPDCSLAQAGLRFVLMQPGVTTAIGGFSARSHLEEAVAASGLGPLTDDTMRRIEGVWQANFGVPPV